MKTLQQIGREQFTEKADHGFLEIYEKLWKPIQNDSIKLLEIGIYNGNSLRTWCEWFPNATIIGIDKNSNNPMRVDRAEINFGDQADPEFLTRMIQKYHDFDIVIDDGGHVWEEQQISFFFLWPHIKPGGMYIIEDLHTSFDYFWRKDDELRTVDILTSLVDNIVTNKEDSFESIEFHYRLAIMRKRV